MHDLYYYARIGLLKQETYGAVPEFALTKEGEVILPHILSSLDDLIHEGLLYEWGGPDAEIEYILTPDGEQTLPGKLQNVACLVAEPEMTIDQLGFMVDLYLYEAFLKDQSHVTPELEIKIKFAGDVEELAGAIEFLVAKNHIRREQFFDKYRWEGHPGKLGGFFNHCQAVEDPALASKEITISNCNAARAQDGLADAGFYLKIMPEGIEAIEVLKGTFDIHEDSRGSDTIT
jgi:hypothetical protein